MRDAVAEGDDDRRAVVGVGLEERLHRLGVLRAERDVRDVDVAVGHRDHAQVLLRPRVAGHRELGRRADRGGLRRLAAGVRVHLGVEHQQVHVAVLRDHVVEAAVADVVRPAVAADDPDALAHQVVGDLLEPPGLERLDARQLLPQLDDALALGGDAGLGRLVGVDDRLDQAFTDLGRHLAKQLVPLLLVLVDRQPEAEAELGVVLEQRVRPGRAAAVAVLRVGRRRQVAAVDRRAAGRVGDEQPVAEQLGQQLDVRRLAAAAQAPEYSNSGWKNCVPLTSSFTMLRSISGRFRKNS